MAAITKSSTRLDGNVYTPFDGFMPPDVKAKPGFNLGQFYAGENLAAGDAVQITSSGQLIRAVGDSAAHARVHGYTTGAASGELTSLYTDVVLFYGSSLTPGAPVYLSASSAGGLDTASSTNCSQPIGFALDDKRVYLFQSHY